MEVLVGSETLPDELGADDLTIFQDQASVGLVRKEDLCSTGDEERVGKAEHNRGENREANRRSLEGMLHRHRRMVQTREGFADVFTICRSRMRCSLHD